MMTLRPVALAYIFFFCCVSIDAGKKKKPIPYEQKSPSSRFDNPTNIKDREKGPSKPPMPVQWKERNSHPFSTAWMDYCAPHHCDDYYKPACGLNRKNMRFKWFQSQCHIILNNQCAYHRGLLKYDIIDAKFCYKYVMDLRGGCPRACGGEVAPVCAWGPAALPVLFQNRCALEKANCGAHFEQYEEVSMAVCKYFWGQALSLYSAFNADESTEAE